MCARVGDGGGEQLDGPRMDADEEDAVFQPVPVFGEEEVDIREFWWGEECLQAHVGVHQDCVAVEPAVETRQLDLSNDNFEGILKLTITT